MKTILIKFAGPLQSWGTSSHFETRKTDRHPSKSAVIGLIASSLGYLRDEDTSISRLNELNFAVRIDQEGRLLRDYHTARDYNKANPYVTERYYLQDAVFVVAINHEDDILMNNIEHGLRKPYFQLFMGRRSLPLNADYLLGTKKDNVIDSIKSVPWQAGRWLQKKYSRKNKNIAYIKLPVYADANLLEDCPYMMRQDNVISFSQKERKFNYRPEARFELSIALDLVTRNEEHDAFSAIGD